MVRATIDVPAGVQAAIERRATDVGLPAIGLWAQVPHYVAAMPYPAASVALLEGLADVAGVRVDSPTLRQEMQTTRERIDMLIGENDEHVRMVQQLEAAVDSEHAPEAGTGLGAGPLPSGDELAAELERYLREQD
jgi:predicted ATP-grasp superfamily ATP-dependent carboligase